MIVFSHRDDPHAYCVQYHADRLGLPFSIVPWHELTTLATASLTIDHDRVSMRWSDKLQDIELGDAKTVWSRRYLSRPVPQAADHRDHSFIRRQSGNFENFALSAILPNARWINPYAAQRRAMSKIWQLSVACDVGFSIPKTIVTNNPEHVRSFFDSFKEHGIIAKPLEADHWFEDGIGFQTYTTRLEQVDIEEDDAIIFSPMIYQSHIPKMFELRCTVIGTTVFCAKLHTQNDELNSIDSRNFRTPLDLKIEPFELPGSVKEKLLLMINRMGLVFGAFDFAVTPEGELIFFEVNESGQWLWIEHLCPDIPLLNAFLRFAYEPYGLSEEVSGVSYDGNLLKSLFDKELTLIQGNFIPDKPENRLVW
jgi:glutathione synthase/RimK-type ligase-like ATP-grasp enzyme